MRLLLAGLWKTTCTKELGGDSLDWSKYSQLLIGTVEGLKSWVNGCSAPQTKPHRHDRDAASRYYICMQRTHLLPGTVQSTRDTSTLTISRIRNTCYTLAS